MINTVKKSGVTKHDATNEEKTKNSTRLNPLKDLLLNISKVTDWAVDNVADEHAKGKKIHEGYKRIKRGVSKEISSDFTINKGMKFEGSIDILDIAIISALDSEFAAGNRYVSLNRLYRDLGGCQHFKPKTREMLSRRVKGLMSTLAEIDISETKAAFYPMSKVDTHITANLICAEMVTQKINGNTVKDVIELKDYSPFYRYADFKGQLEHIDAEILNVPLRLSDDNVALFWGLLDTVTRIVRSNSNKRGKCGKYAKSPMNTTILFSTLLKKCGVKITSRKDGARVREYVAKILDHFKSVSLIGGFKIEKRDDGYCIKLDLTTPCKD